ncbi:hypothetical protein ANO11243_078710 [Dothideomycetidae sp. 11243]|nr:hypothetical protein ANO11243_078710 [fungal sp. No.11243]
MSSSYHAARSSNSANARSGTSFSSSGSGSSNISSKPLPLGLPRSIEPPPQSHSTSSYSSYDISPHTVDQDTPFHNLSAAQSALHVPAAQRRRSRPWVTATARNSAGPASHSIPSLNAHGPDSRFPHQNRPDLVHLHHLHNLHHQDAYIHDHDTHDPTLYYPTYRPVLAPDYDWYAAVGLHDSQSVPASYLHSRHPSDVTVTTNGPDSPVLQTTSYPFIASQDASPLTNFPWGGNVASQYLDSQAIESFSHQQIQQRGYLPTRSRHTSAPHAALKDMAIDHHNSASSEDVPDFVPSRRSDSTHGHNTPNTPETMTAEEVDGKGSKTSVNAADNQLPRISMNGYSRLANSELQRGKLKLIRTESDACEEVLYNPHNFDGTGTSPPPPAATSNPPRSDQGDHLSPRGNLVNEVLRTANSIRSQSPAPPIARQRSPFRQGADTYAHLDSPSTASAPGAANDSFSQSTGAAMPSAASIRQMQKEQADRQERDRPKLRREVTKTMSPKDALLDAPDVDGENTLPSFSDIIPDGYQKHAGGSETFQNNFITGTNQAFAPFVPLNQPSTNHGGFRAVDLDNWLSTPMAASAAAAAVAGARASQPVSSQLSDKNPEFPAQLTSMESSHSENPPLSSQESVAPLPIKRPSNTSANTGTYTCTYHGCTLRFESPAILQKHKREVHQSIPSHRASTTPDDDGVSDSASPEPIGSGMTSSEILARNSQSGPHKCNRTNPTTGKPCNAIFSRPYDLTRHEDTIHNRKKDKVRCEYCREERTFSRNDALTRHMRVVHPEIDHLGKRGRRVY